MHDKYFRLIELIKQNLALGYFEAKHCHETLFIDNSNFETEQKSLIYLNRSARYMDLAYSIYQNNLEELENSSIENVFHLFNVFYNEATTNIATNHSHQWSDIEFRRYKDSLYDWVPESAEED